jgi:hypothetical protein
MLPLPFPPYEARKEVPMASGLEEKVGQPFRIYKVADLKDGEWADALPPLSDEEYEAFKAAIKGEGVLTPILLDEDEATVLEGPHVEKRTDAKGRKQPASKSNRGRSNGSRSRAKTQPGEATLTITFTGADVEIPGRIKTIAGAEEIGANAWCVRALRAAVEPKADDSGEEEGA